MTSSTYALVEQNQPLESSVIWEWMKEFYQEGGTDVWSGGDIPFHITNTPVLAEQWSDSILATLRDLHRLKLTDPSQPILIFELGPGTGRHAYFLYRSLAKVEQVSRALTPGGYRFRLVLAELGEKGLAAFAQHSELKSPIANGEISLARFDVQSDRRPVPWSEGRPSPLHLPSANPVFVLCNYVIDSLPHDVLRIEGSKIQRAHASVSVEGLLAGQAARDLPNLGERIKIEFTYPKTQVVYRNAVWREILTSYQSLRDPTHIPFPTCALRLLERIRTWSKSATVLLAADKSFTHLEQLRELEEPEVVGHGGGFSFNANMHTLGLYAETLGGFAHHTTCRDGTLDLSHLVLPPKDSAPLTEEQLLELVYTLEKTDRFHAVDRFRLKEGVDAVAEAPNFRLSLDLLRLSGFDPQSFYELSDHILFGLEHEEIDEESHKELRLSLDPVLDGIFHVGDDTDVAFEVGRVAYRLENYELAHKAFELSLEQFGPDPKAYFNIGLGWYYRRRFDLAESAFLSALKTDSTYRDAQLWLRKTKRRQAQES